MGRDPPVSYCSSLKSCSKEALQIHQEHQCDCTDSVAQYHCAHHLFDTILHSHKRERTRHRLGETSARKSSLSHKTGRGRLGSTAPVRVAVSHHPHLDTHSSTGERILVVCVCVK